MLCRLISLVILLTSQCTLASKLLLDDSIVWVGRVRLNDDQSVSFDMNGVQMSSVVTGATSLYAAMSQVERDASRKSMNDNLKHLSPYR